VADTFTRELHSYIAWVKRCLQVCIWYSLYSGFGALAFTMLFQRGQTPRAEIWAPPDSTTQTASRSSQPFFSAAHWRVCLYFTCPPSPPKKNYPFPWRDPGPHLIHGFVGPLESTTQTACRSVLTIFVGLTVMTNRQTHRPHCNDSKRPDLCTLCICACDAA